jgi:hypothetical protein
VTTGIKLRPLENRASAESYTPEGHLFAEFMRGADAKCLALTTAVWLMDCIATSIN